MFVVLGIQFEGDLVWSTTFDNLQEGPT